MGDGYSPDPPSRHPAPPADDVDGDTLPTPAPRHNLFSELLARPGYVSHPTYGTPPMWETPSCVDPDEQRKAAQRAANDSGCEQHMRERDGSITVLQPEVPQ